MASPIIEPVTAATSASRPRNSIERKVGKMNRFKSFLLDANSIKQAAKNCLKRWRLAVPIAITGLMLIFAAQAQNSAPQEEKVQRAPLRFSLTPASNAIGACIPDAKARVVVFPKEGVAPTDIRGGDVLDLKAEGLPANTTFAVFLTALAGPPFGAAEYIGDFTTNAEGKGSMRVNTIVEEAFSSTLVGNNRVRRELNHVVMWFADPAADDFCPGPVSAVTTPFDGDGQAGTAALSSRSFLPGAPLP